MLQAIVVYGMIIAIYLLIRKFSRVPQYYFLILIMLVSLLFYFPGVSQDDTNWLYQNFIIGTYNDWQPPLYTVWWHIFRFRPAAFVINLLVYYSGVIYLSKILYDKKLHWQNDLLVIFSLYPLFATQLVIILKDVQYTGFIVLSIVMLIILGNSKFWWQKIISSIAIVISAFFIIGIKYNGLFAVSPIVLYGIYLWMSEYFGLRLKRYVIYIVTGAGTFSILLILVMANNFISYHVFAAKHSRSSLLVMYNDLVNIQCQTGEQIIPEKLFTSPDSQDIMCDNFFINFINYEPQTVANWSGANNPTLFDYDFNDNKMTDGEYGVIRQLWLSTVITHPRAYIEYRMKYFINIIFHQWWWTPIQPDVTDSFQQKMASIVVEERQNFKELNGLFIILGNLLILGISIRRKSKLSLVVICSSWLQLLSLFLLLGVPAARFFLWNYLAVIIGGVLLYDPTKQPIAISKSRCNNK